MFCITKCTTIHPDVPGHTPPDDRTLMGLVTPGPPLQNPELVEQGLAKSLLRVGTPMEAGFILMNSVLSTLSERADLLGEDGSAELTGIATVSLPNASTAIRPDYTSECVETCIEILGHQVLCFEECHARIE